MENGTILIVDDNKSVLASLELLLENEFGTVRTAANPPPLFSLFYHEKGRGNICFVQLLFFKHALERV